MSCKPATMAEGAFSVTADAERAGRQNSRFHQCLRRGQPPTHQPDRICSTLHTVTSDSGNVLISSTIQRCSQERRVKWHYTGQDKPTQYGLSAASVAACGTKNPTKAIPLAGPCPFVLAAWPHD